MLHDSSAALLITIIPFNIFSVMAIPTIISNMATLPTELDTFTITLGNSAHWRAEEYCSQYSDPDKAEAIYLNTLSIWAVDHYLQLLGYPTTLEHSDSHSLLTQMITDSAGLMIAGFGQVECRPIEPGDIAMSIPPETWGSRIAYIAVQLDTDLETATILGFVPQTSKATIALETLRPLTHLTHHLNQFERIDLAAWWNDVFQPNWEAIAQLFDSWDLAPAMRSRKGTTVSQQQAVERGCKMTIGDRHLSVLVNLQRSEGHEYDIRIEFWPVDTPYLPPGLHLSILDEDELPVLEAHSKEDSEAIEMTFQGETGDCFSVQIKLNDLSLTREFLL